MSSSPPIPGLYYTTAPPRAEPSPLRTDVAGFFGRTRRGPVGRAQRVRGWREFSNLFGGLEAGAMTTYALRGYFENGGDVAYVVRLLGEQSQPARATWRTGSYDPASKALDPDWPGDGGFLAIEYVFEANSPGDWANDTVIEVRYWSKSASGTPELEIEIAPPGEDIEILTGIAPKDLAVVTQLSKYVRVTPSQLPTGLAPADLSTRHGPRYYAWPAVRLSGGSSMQPVKEDYLAAVITLGDEPEVALVASPDLYHPDLYRMDEPSSTSAIVDITGAMLTQAERLHDRLVILDVPPDQADALAAVQWVDQNVRNCKEPGAALNEAVLRTGAVYHPRVLVPDPLGTAAAPLRCVPSSGLVAGVISRLDQQQGAYITPANAPIKEAVDFARPLNAKEQATVYAGGLNLLTCSPSQGLLVWGGRVLGKAVPGGFLAHRRLIHLLVRAIRRVADPLVFDPNGPQLWLALVRSITTVLLAAYRAGALKGNSPEEAFRVQCDAKLNPPEQVAQGKVMCKVQVAPAVPMEFITLRIAVSAQGQLEVFES